MREVVHHFIDKIPIRLRLLVAIHALVYTFLGPDCQLYQVLMGLRAAASCVAITCAATATRICEAS